MWFNLSECSPHTIFEDTDHVNWGLSAAENTCAVVTQWVIIQDSLEDKNERSIGIPKVGCHLIKWEQLIRVSVVQRRGRSWSFSWRTFTRANSRKLQITKLLSLMPFKDDYCNILCKIPLNFYFLWQILSRTGLWTPMTLVVMTLI